MSRPCLICTAPTTYAHAGVDACRSCADFYRRSMLAGRTFPCRKGDGQCTVNQKDRHNCRGCRFARCAALGMKLDLKEKNKSGVNGSSLIEEGLSPQGAQDSTERAQHPTTFHEPPGMHCLICVEPIANSRLGVNACRACAAFFKRADPLFDQLKCRRRTNNCRARDPKTSCRKCRLVRFRDVLSRAGENFPVLEYDSQISAQEDQKPPFIDHTSFYDCVPSHSDTPLLMQIMKGYSYMCVIRRCGESPLTDDYRGNGVVQKENLTLTPASYSSFVHIHSIEREAMLECANFAFDEFRALDGSSKSHIIDRSLLVVDVLESTYRACHHFPNDREIRFSGYTTYLREADLEAFFENCPDEIDKAMLIREFKHTLKRLSTIVRKLFEVIKPSDIEFIALLGLAFWKEENMMHDENLLKISSHMRSEIMRELHVYYAKRGTSDYAYRLGGLYCLIMNCEDCAAQFAEDFQLFRLLKLWESSFRLKE